MYTCNAHVREVGSFACGAIKMSTDVEVCVQEKSINLNTASVFNNTRETHFGKCSKKDAYSLYRNTNISKSSDSL